MNKHLSLHSEINYILRVLNSCVSVEQVNNVQRWGLNFITRTYKRIYGDKAFYYGTAMNHQYVHDFECLKDDIRIKLKNIESHE